MATYHKKTDRLALITGASEGLGLTLAKFLAAQGFNLIVTARGAGRLSQAQERLLEYGLRVKAVAGDVSDLNHRRQVEETVRNYGGLDLLINNASTIGASPMPYLVDYPLELIRQVFEANTIAPLALIQALRPYLAIRQGLIVNLSSDAATGGYEGWGGYGASKAALDLISLTLANELQEEGISVVSVDPGDMRTTMHQEAFPGEDISDRPLPEVTLPFWAWLVGQEKESLNDISGRRFQAQADLWEVPA